ncbi:MAG: rRNA pseudouridine synthase [Chloroflexi bacterium]|nr:rRNA pseudouridine synthase [Chloroflexota bacterium]
MQERLQKYLARCGVASRRGAEVLITQGRITVNGRTITKLGSKVNPARDAVLLDGKAVAPPATFTYLALHKPAGYLTTRDDPHNRPTVCDLLPTGKKRLVPVGRLDTQSEGLLFLTNDGAWAHRVAHPRYGGEKEYAVLVNGALTPQQYDALRSPMTLDGYRLNPVAVERIDRESESGTWISLTLTEGRKRQIRQMLAAVGKHAVRLIRTRIGPVRLGKLAPGKLRPLTENEIAHWRAPRQSPDPERGAPTPALSRSEPRLSDARGKGGDGTPLAGTATGKSNRDQD